MLDIPHIDWRDIHRRLQEWEAEHRRIEDGRNQLFMDELLNGPVAAP